MRAVVTRVNSAEVRIDGITKAAIGGGFLVLLGVHENDGGSRPTKSPIKSAACGFLRIRTAR